MLTFVAWRLATLVFISLAIPQALDRSSRPLINLGLLALVGAESAIRLWLVIRRRSCLSTTWTSIDVGLALLCLVAEPWYVPHSDLVGTWTGWAPGFAVNVAICIGTGFPKRRQTFLLAITLAITYGAVSAPAIGRYADASTVLVNMATYPAFALICRGMATTIRRFGADADAARERAVEATRRLEAERSRRLLHDPASLLRYLADPALEPELVDALRAQALTEANRIRAYLSQAPHHHDESDGHHVVSLVGAVRAATEEFTDLQIDVVLDLASPATLDPESAQALTAAATTVLHNVRRHAGHDVRVVVHGDYLPDTGQWEITIRDDGIGFDLATTTLGFGLSQIADAALAEHNIASTVHSQPGIGTTITMRGTSHDAQNQAH